MTIFLSNAVARTKVNDPSVPPILIEFCRKYCQFNCASQIGTASRKFQDHLATLKHQKIHAAHFNQFSNSQSGLDNQMEIDSQEPKSNILPDDNEGPEHRSQEEDEGEIRELKRRRTAFETAMDYFKNHEKSKPNRTRFEDPPLPELPTDLPIDSTDDHQLPDELPQPPDGTPRMPYVEFLKKGYFPFKTATASMLAVWLETMAEFVPDPAIESLWILMTDPLWEKQDVPSLAELRNWKNWWKQTGEKLPQLELKKKRSSW